MNIGDKVSAIDDPLSGTVTSLHGNDVCFRDEHGFIHRYERKMLVVQNASIYNGMAIEQKAEHQKKISRRHAAHQYTLDLHFEKLVHRPSDFESFERLFIQKEKLLQSLDYCRKHHIKKLVIIHGIGDGVLQNMVHDVLSGQANLEFLNNEILHHQSSAVIVHFK